MMVITFIEFLLVTTPTRAGKASCISLSASISKLASIVSREYFFCCIAVKVAKFSAMKKTSRKRKREIAAAGKRKV
jgi:hypothetical protein